MELRRGGVGSQARARRMDGDSRDGGGGCKDAGSEDYENLPTSASLSTHMTAGAMAGILEHSVMYPVDSVKVRRQETLENGRAHACAYASRAGAAWKQPSATALSLAPRRPPDLLGPTGSWRAQPGRLGVRRVAPSAVRLGPRGQPPPPSRAHEGAPAGAPLRRSRRVPGPGCWRRCRRRGEGESTAGLGGGGGAPDGAGRYGFEQSYHVWPRDRRVCGPGWSRLPLARSVSEPRRVASAGRCRVIGAPAHVRRPRGARRRER